MHLPNNGGYIEVITGPMFSGKSEELIRRVRRYRYAKKKIIVMKPMIDDRYSKSEVVSHNNNKIEAICIQTAEDILNNEPDELGVVAIDEIQFIQDSILEDGTKLSVVDVLEKLADNGHIVIVSGLDQTFQGEPFGFMGELLAKADYVTKLSAVCVKCGAPATKSQRLIDGKPAKYNDPVVLVGSHETYEARCRKCFEIEKE